MFIQPIPRIFSAALALTTLILSATSPRGQTPEAPQSTLQRELVQIRAKNAAIQDELRKLEERDLMLLQLVKELQRRCDGSGPFADGATNHADSTHRL